MHKKSSTLGSLLTGIALLGIGHIAQANPHQLSYSDKHPSIESACGYEVYTTTSEKKEMLFVFSRDYTKKDKLFIPGYVLTNGVYVFDAFYNAHILKDGSIKLNPTTDPEFMERIPYKSTLLSGDGKFIFDRDSCSIDATIECIGSGCK